MDKDDNVVEFIPKEEYEKTLSRLADSDAKKVSIPRSTNFTRKDVVLAFENAFQMIGGVPRLAQWAHDNPTDFFKLYARLLPSQASAALGESNEVIVKHVLPRTALDE